jgi:hypothetical protein
MLLLYNDVSENFCSGCYWFLTTHKGEQFCLIAQDEDKRIFTKNICDEKITRLEAIKKWK